MQIADIEFWKEAPEHTASDEVIARFLMNVAFMVDKLQKKTCFYCAEPIRMQTASGGSTAYVHTEAQDMCKTSKCAARSVKCTKCEKAGLSHFHHVRAACPFKFEFCKKIAADKKFKDKLITCTSESGCQEAEGKGGEVGEATGEGKEAKGTT